MTFHRVIPGFMAQTGDPTGTGGGGSKLPNLPAEFNQTHFKRGVLGMARTDDPNSANSQFFIMFGDGGFLDGKYTAFGEVTSGMDAVDKIKAGTEGNNGAVDNPDKIVTMRMAWREVKRSNNMSSAGDTLTLETTKGPVVIEMNPALAPGHVAHIKSLVSEGFYDGIVFHRVIDGFMAQTGCPHGTGTGGSKYPDLKAEFNAEPHKRGTVSMARASSPDSANSQFFICFADAPFLDQAIYGLGQGRLGDGERRQDQARRAGPRSRQDRQGDAELRSSRRDDAAVTPGRPRLPPIDSSDRMAMTAMRVDAFDFVLPPERIALSPANPRDSARMLVVGAEGGLTDAHVRDLPDFLSPGDALVINDTRVIAARLEGMRARGEAVASIEATLIERVDDCRWRALVRPAKRLKIGERIRFGEASESMACLLAALDAEVEEKGEVGEVLLRFDFAGAALDEAIERLGAPPLPPYIASRRAPRRATARTTRRCLRPNPARSPRRRRGCISPRRWSTVSQREASRYIALRCMSAREPSRRSRPRIPATTRCTPNGVRWTRRRRTR